MSEGAVDLEIDEARRNDWDVASTVRRRLPRLDGGDPIALKRDDVGAEIVRCQDPAEQTVLPRWLRQLSTPR
jgi:hypothetical protein